MGIIAASACTIRVRGVVQGVGFRPFVYRLARANTLAGWVLNGEEGVEIYLEGDELRLQAFVQDLKTQTPPAASIAVVEVRPADPTGVKEFTIRESQRHDRPTVRISPDLPVCDACLKELFDPADRRYRYPYINCTNCGPRYTVVVGLPYDRPNTTMQRWPLDEYCNAEYRDPGNRRFHAQPVACPECGPVYSLRVGTRIVQGVDEGIREAVGASQWRQHSGGERARWISPVVRCVKYCGCRCFAPTQIPQGKTFCSHGEGPGCCSQSG